jgi:hypothetical protein
MSSFAIDPIRDLTGKRLDQHAQGVANSLEKWRRRPINYPIERAQEVFFDVCSTPQKGYREYLRSQVGRWWSLPDDLVVAIQRYYPEVNLRSVRFAMGVRTANGAATTFGTDIYFPRQIYYSNAGDLHWMLHELEHTVQYARRSSDSEFLCEYAAKLLGRGLQDESTDIERAADRKADFVLPIAHQALYGPPQWRGYAANAQSPQPFVSTICRSGQHWQYVSPAPVGTACYMPAWRMNGRRGL